MKCKHLNGCEMRFKKLLSQTYEGEVSLLYEGFCNDCNKKIDTEIKYYQY